MTSKAGPADPRVIEARIERFTRLGGVDLSGLEPEQREETLAYARIGIQPLKKAKFRFWCPVCRKYEHLNTEMEPMCTGPSWTDDHEPTVMIRVRQ